MPASPSLLADPDLLLGIPLPWRNLAMTWEWMANNAWALLPMVLLLWIPIVKQTRPKRHFLVWLTALVLAWSIWLAPLGQWLWSTYLLRVEGLVCTYIPHTKGAYPLSLVLAFLVGPLHAWRVCRSRRPFNPQTWTWIFALLPTAIAFAGYASIFQAWGSLFRSFTGHV